MLWAVLLLAQDFSFAPPDAAFVASLDVKQVRAAVEHWVREAGVKSPVSWKVLDRVERVQVAISMRNGEPQMVAVLEGNFKETDVMELQKAATGRDAMQVKLLDERRILISDAGMPRTLPAVTPAPARPKFAVVHGMNGGPKEIPLQ